MPLAMGAWSSAELQGDLYPSGWLLPAPESPPCHMKGLPRQPAAITVDSCCRDTPLLCPALLPRASVVTQSLCQQDGGTALWMGVETGGLRHLEV